MKCILDIENGIGPEDIFGTLIIEGENNKFLAIDDTYIDSWLLSCGDYILGTNRISNEIDIIEEPDVIKVECRGERLFLSYHEKQIVLSITDFSSDVLKALKFLVSILSQKKTNERLSLIARLNSKARMLEKHIDNAGVGE